MSKAEQIKNSIHQLVEEYHQLKFPQQEFVPGVSTIPVSGKLIDHNELIAITDAALDAWFTTGRFNSEFEKNLAKYIGVKHLITVNSGSSANLVAFSVLTASEHGEKAIKPGDEVITVAASFPTTINPIIQYGAIPVFLDVDIPTYEIKIEDLEKALSPKTKAVVIAHTMGNAFNLDAITAFCKKYGLWLMEDCCDALGTTYKGKHVGTFGDIATLSFYPAHHITMGEGGAVYLSNSKLKKIAESFRDWGRDCWCEPGKDNTCGKRFCQQCGDLPFGYDHKYIYSRSGFNLKITDMQAALGLAQLDKLQHFVNRRKENFEALKKGLKKWEHKLILPKATEHSDPSWFGFLITIRKDAGITRNELIEKLTEHKIGTRLLFAGDIRKQPYFKNVTYRNVGTFDNTELIVNQTFWVGVCPSINSSMVGFVVSVFDEIMAKY